MLAGQRKTGGGGEEMVLWHYGAALPKGISFFPLAVNARLGKFVIEF